MSDFEVHIGDARKILPSFKAGSAHTVVTSPPYYGLRNYGVDGQIGLEKTPEAYVAELVEVFREVHRVLRDDGTVWLNLGDSYAGSGKGPSGNFSKGGGADRARNMWKSEGAQHTSGFVPDGLKPKDLIGIPWRVAFALQADGWYLRQDIIWHKPNPMPESVKDRCTKAHEYIFLLSKSAKYYCDMEAVKELEVCGRKREPALHPDTISTNGNDGLCQRESNGLRNKRSVWTVITKPYKGAHFATFPPALIEPCVLAGAPHGGVVLDPFMGAGTTGVVALQHFRKFIGIELNSQYVDELALPRLKAAI